MNDIIGKLKNDEKWTISVQLLVLYVVSVGIFLAAHEIFNKIVNPQKDKVVAGSIPASLLALVVAVAVNAAGVALLVFISAKTGTNPRLAMVAVPLILTLEKHVRAMRAAPQDRRLHLLAMAGVVAGMCGTTFALMRNAPIK